MSGDSSLIKWGVLIAAVIIVVRIVLEQIGTPESISFIFGVAWLYFILPILFAFRIRARKEASPYKSLFISVLLFAFYTRVIVMLTYILAYFLRWQAPRFAYPGGNVGENVGVWTGILIIPLRNVLIWVVMSTIIGMILGSITLLVKRKAPEASPAG
jgi:hypothetical protein